MRPENFPTQKVWGFLPGANWDLIKYGKGGGRGCRNSSNLKESAMVLWARVVLLLQCVSVLKSSSIEDPKQLKFQMEVEGSKVVRKGDDLNVTCVTVDSSIPGAEWIQPERMSGGNSNSTTIVGNLLQLKNVQVSGNYTCVAKSKEQDRIERTMLITVQDLPHAPFDLRVSEVTDSSLRLEWYYPLSPHVYTSSKPSHIMYYMVLYKPHNPSWPTHHGKQDLFEISDITENQYTIKNLNSSKEYEFHVLAVNLLGRGPVSKQIYATTKGTVPKSSPTHVKAKYLSQTSLLIRWAKPEIKANANRNHGHYQYSTTSTPRATAYKVYYTSNPDLGIEEWSSQVDIANRDWGGITIISGLAPLTVYTVMVQAYTTNGPTPISPPIQVKTQYRVPSQPSDIRVVNRTTTSISLVWDPPVALEDAQEPLINGTFYENITYEWETVESGTGIDLDSAHHSVGRFEAEAIQEEGHYNEYSEGRYAKVAMKVILTRKLSFYLLQTYVPSGLLVLISWLSYLINPEHVPGRMLVCVATILANSTMFTGFQSQMPTVSYVKAIDVWMMACIAFGIFSLVEFSVVIHMGKRWKDINRTPSPDGSLFARLPFQMLPDSISGRALTKRPPPMWIWNQEDVPPGGISTCCSDVHPVENPPGGKFHLTRNNVYEWIRGFPPGGDVHLVPNPPPTHLVKQPGG
ncbi:unnamed protein product [Darwinula stevensoni]|uniref:Uncharacterized protein n=1 Tax=Darwinula stevensoni TaxID=69355 RepID=A0A7R8XBC0_9CRUS|nr:unnamed protein product [Darwinula stevensoni]CAG0884648.1 unnamed protein product [Darwinula stevensoni]